MAQIALQSLSFFGLHGFFEHERRQGNRFEVDVDVLVPEPSGSDQLEDSVDYTRIAAAVESVMCGPSVLLLETLLMRLGQAVLDCDARIAEVTVRVRKMNPPMKPGCKFVQLQHTWRRTS